jgi:hypothetical protein
MQTDHVAQEPKPRRASGDYHGTLHGYITKRCRCSDCCQAQRDYTATYRASDRGRDASRRAASRNNFMRQSALTWVRNNHPEVIDAFSAEWEEKLATQHRA